MRKFRFLTAFLVIATLKSLTAPYIAIAASQECDRSCLTSFMTTYLNAMVANTPDTLPITKSFRFTEDSHELKLGEGLWLGASSLESFRQDIVDTRAGVIGTYAVINEHGQKILLSVRLKVEGLSISEIETMVVRNQEEGMIFEIDEIVEANPQMNYFPNDSVLNNREELVSIAELYPAGLQDGGFIELDVPFTEKAYRFENGLLMAGPGCTAFENCDNIKTQTFPKLTEASWRVMALDEQLGIALLRINFGDGSGFNDDAVLVVWEAFKVYDGQIQAVETFMKLVPDGEGSGWD